MKALISGISGQDGSYLSEYLLSKGYEVFGIIRRNSVPEHQESRIHKLDIKTYYGDLLDICSLEKIMKEVMPDEIYNLAAQSHVRISFDIPQFTAQTNAIGVINMLETYRQVCPRARFYQASSSEMFGNTFEITTSQNELTRMNPVSPYGCAKVFGYNIVRHYRRAYGLFACNGILFNHESPRRASNFVTNKVVKTAVEIKRGLKNELVLGNMKIFRDWGHSKDYVRAMHMIVNHKAPSDFVVATGKAHSISELCEYVFGKLKLHLSRIRQDEKYMRPEELIYLKGDSSKIRSELGWKPEYTFESMLDEMIEFWENEL